MPRDSSGNYFLPTVYHVNTGDTILPSQHNGPLEDIQTALTGSLARNGTGGMTGDLDLAGHNILNAGNVISGGKATPRNLLINPQGTVFQRISPPLTDDTYTNPSHWLVLTESGAISQAQVSPGGGITKGFTWINKSGSAAQRFALVQIVESQDCIDCQSATMFLSGSLTRVGTTDRLWRYAILGWNGTPDAVTSDVVNNWSSPTLTPGNFFISSVSVIAIGSCNIAGSDPVSIPAISGIVPYNATNLICIIWSDQQVTQNEGILPNWIQLEKGTTASEFAARPYGEELALCQRFYQQWPVYIGTSPNDTALILPVAMRKIPTITGAGAGFTIDYSDKQSFTMRQTSGSLAVLTFDAEL